MTEDSLAQQVENPKLTLYAFHLCHDMTLGEGERVEDCDRLWQTFEELGQELAIAPLATCRQWFNLPENGGTVPFRELLSQEIDRCLRFPIPQSRRNGELYALQLHDTYAADLTFRYSGSVSVDQLSHLNPQGKLLPDRIQASLGQTLVLFAKPLINGDTSHPETLQKFADRCLKALLAEADSHWQNLSYIAQGKLLGSPIFEYDNFAEDPAQSCHILIWLNCHPDTTPLEASATYYEPLINLLCSRSKIRFSYHQARQRYRDARKIYQQLETVMQGLQTLPADTAERLTFLKGSISKTTPKAFTYASYIRDIEDQRTAIITNFRNYITALNHLNQLEGENELKLFQDFSDRRSQFLGQIRTDLNYLMPGKTLFGDCIATMRGIVEVEQAEINNKLQETEQDLQDHIQAIGVGIAAGAIVASSFGLVTQPWYFPNREKIELPFLSPHPLIMALIFSGLCSVGSWLIARKVIEKKRGK
ncbi:hypothetical protein JJD41_03825 [Oxynema sp. CENA135]|uniref:hypothetical protein n=1 Tax=Oxynema sp. CENA135 TaxID=984206 RepID=UPI00190BBF91|nr:hypothetical protein [Oxynema sp. CENA135]MBK4729021.1 hypothetical protein [Oxynema sp. CENA135]